MNENSNGCSCCFPCIRGTGGNPCENCNCKDGPTENGFCDNPSCSCASAVEGRGE